MTLLAAAPLLTIACKKTFKGSVSQPNPLIEPVETLRHSEHVTIVTGDMELRVPNQQGPGTGGTVMVGRRYPLKNIANFTVVSRDRLRFHVQVEHKWEEWADLANWKAYLVDDQGRRYVPESVEGGAPRHLASMWDYETRSVVRNVYRDIVAVRQDGHRRRRALGSMSVFRSQGDLVFYSRDIFTPDVKKLTLVLERRSLAFTWTWKFSDDTVEGPPGMPGQRIPFGDEVFY